jgi:hypothetical protein
MSYEPLSIKSPKPAVIECLLAPGENRVSVKFRYPDMVSTERPPQAQPPSRETTSLKEFGTHPKTHESQNLLFEAARSEPKSFRQRHQKDGGLP